MANPTLNSIREDAKKLILDLPSDLTDAVVESYVNQAQAEAEDRYGFLDMEEEQSFVTVSSPATRALGTKDTRWARRRGNPYYVDGLGKDTPMAWIADTVELRKRYAKDDPLEIGAPGHLRETDTQIEVYPLPDGLAPTGSVWSDGEYRVRVPFWKREVTLDSSNQENWFTLNARYYLTWFAAAEGMLFNRDREEFLTWKNRAEAELMRLIRRDRKLRVSRDLVLKPRTDVHAVSAR